MFLFFAKHEDSTSASKTGNSPPPARVGIFNFYFIFGKHEDSMSASKTGTDLSPPPARVKINIFFLQRFNESVKN